MKTCVRCSKSKPLDEFYRAKGERRRGECKTCSNAQERERYKGARKEARSGIGARTKRYGLTVAQYQGLIEEQGGRCAICGTAEPGGKGTWHIDHGHDCCPGAGSCGVCVRGLLCSRCNMGLGHFRDDPALLRSAADYLENRS